MPPPPTASDRLSVLNTVDRDVQPLRPDRATCVLPDSRRRLPPISVAASGLGLALLFSGCAAAPEPPLPQFAIDPSRTSVSGMSSGAYMAQQLHLAFADRIGGAALLAGGPYGCAKGDLQTALGRCMMPPGGAGPDVEALAETVRERAAAGTLAPLDALTGDRVFVWHGQFDETVGQGVSRAAAALQRRINEGSVVVEDFDDPVAHLLPTTGQGGDCTRAQPPYIAACGIDLAGKAIRALYPDTPAPGDGASGTLHRFDAAAFADGDSPGAALGFVYVPVACAAGEPCGLHIALHGCQQDVGSIGEAFAEGAGFNRWADAAKLVVLYPQAAASYVPLNPKACWDWWGYTGEDYDTRSGVQLRWIAAMAAAIGAPLRD